MELIINPNEKNLSEIEEWLSEEWQESHLGFYCNWEIIYRAFRTGRLCIISENDSAIGFIVYKFTDLVAKIDIAEIRPSKRNNGIAKIMIEEFSRFLLLKGVLVIRLCCLPKSTEIFWKKIGFINFPMMMRHNKVEMYKPLVDYYKPTNYTKSDSDKLLLWKCKTHQRERENPVYEWKLNFVSGKAKLLKPIIQPANYKWNFKIIIDGKTEIEDEIRRVPNDEVDFDEFLIIRELNVNS